MLCVLCLQAALEKRPSDRSPREIRKLLPLIQSIKSYKALDEPVQTFLATYANLEVVWESVEPPKTSKLFKFGKRKFATMFAHVVKPGAYSRA
jgi:hypothetical protein